MNRDELEQLIKSKMDERASEEVVSKHRQEALSKNKEEIFKEVATWASTISGSIRIEGKYLLNLHVVNNILYINAYIDDLQQNVQIGTVHRESPYTIKYGPGSRYGYEADSKGGLWLHTAQDVIKGICDLIAETTAQDIWRPIKRAELQQKLSEAEQVVEKIKSELNGL